MRDASLSSLDTGFLPVSRIADAVVRHGAHAVRTPVRAVRHASGARGVPHVVREPAVAGALIRPGAPGVQARVLAHRVNRASRLPSLVTDASPGVGIVAESRFADAHVRSYALAVRSAAVHVASRGRVSGDGCRRVGYASTDRGIYRESRLAGATVVPDADTVRTAVVSADDRLRGVGGRGDDASTGVGVHGVSVRALRRARGDRDASVGAAVPRVSRPASADVRHDALAADAAAVVRANRPASAVLVATVAGLAAADAGRDAVAAVATGRALGDAGLVVAGRIRVSAKN